MLSVVIFFPVAGAVGIALVPRERESWAKWIAALTAAIVLGVVIGLFVAYDRDDKGYQFVNHLTLLDSSVSKFRFQYLVGLDGLSLPLVLLMAFLGVVSVLI